MSALKKKKTGNKRKKFPSLLRERENYTFVNLSAIDSAWYEQYSKFIWNTYLMVFRKFYGALTVWVF